MTRSGRTLLAVTFALLVALTVWTVLIATTTVSGFVLDWSRSRVAPEVVGMVAAVLTTFLVYVRYSVSGSERFLYVALGFVVLAFSQLVLSVSVSEQAAVVPEQAVYFWTIGRILAAVMLVLGAVTPSTADPETEDSARRFLLLTASVMALLAAVDAIIAGLDQLPALSSATPQMARESSGILPGLTATDLVIGSVGTALYLTAAVLYLRPFDRPPAESMWLAPGLVIAAFSHLHYMFFPVILSDVLSTGDLLRILFAAVLLGGVAWEVRRTALAERDRAAELQALYAGERVRVQELEEIDRTKAELFSVLTHELAHPVATLRGFVVSLISRWDELDDGTRIRALQRMDQESRRLRDLAEEVVSVSHLDSPGYSVTIRSERVRDLIREVTGATGDLDGRLVVRVGRMAKSAEVMVDRARMLQVFRNLLSNAAKYSPEGSPVGLEASIQDDHVLFSVTDQGPGIPAEDIPRLFNQFTRLHQPGEEDIGGSGLGLYISRRIVEAHQGRIWAESEPGAGSVFNVALPRTKDER
jgi:signal transduction histidine kinase